MNNPSESWTLFLDRDGIINYQKTEGYISHVNEFKLIPDVIETLEQITPFFKRIFIITNQQGVGKGITKIENLLEIHRLLFNVFKDKGIKIHGIFFCPHLKGTCLCRKPSYGMITRLVHIFPDVEPRKSVFIGDDIKDVLLAIRIGSYPIFIGDRSPLPGVPAFTSLRSAKDYIINLRTT